MDSAIQPPLDYAPAPRRSRRSLWLIIACLLLSGIAWIAWSQRSQIATSYNSWSEARSVRRLMAYEAPSNQVAWDGVTAARAPVARAGGVAVVFLHGRTTPGGRQFLVIVEYVLGRSGHGPHLAAMIIEPGGVTRWSRHNGPFVAMADDGLFSGATPPKLYAGQADPNDASRFTIRYELGAERGVLKGVVTDPPATAPTWEFGGVQITRHPDVPHAP